MGFEFRVAVNSQKCGTRFKDGSCWNCTCFTIRVEGMVMFARVRVVSALCGILRAAKLPKPGFRV